MINAIAHVEDEVIASGLDIDMDADGFVNNIIFIIQGDQDAWGSLLWPMSVTYFEAFTSLRDKSVINYNKQFTGWLEPPTLCHEFFHTIGAPDLYRYHNNEIVPIGYWDLMAYGDSNMLAFMKWNKVTL